MRVSTQLVVGFAIVFVVLGEEPTRVCAQKATSSSGAIASAQSTSSSGQVLLARPPDTRAFRPVDEGQRKVPVAVGGFCVVTLHDHRKWVAGSKKIHSVFDGKAYLFADTKKRVIFNANPERYAPALNGDCVVTFATAGKRVSGKLEYGLVHRRRVFFFADASQLEEFRSHPEQYVHADLANNGLCVVSKVEEGRNRVGLPQTLAIVRGLRYYFANAHYRSMFLENSSKYEASLHEKGPKESQATAPKPLDAANELSLLPVPKDPSELPIKEKSGKIHFPGSSDVESPESFSLDGRNQQKRESASSADQQSLAMEGYSPVSIGEQGLWIKGKLRHKCEFDGKIYSFANSEELADFQAEPKTFAPVLGGDCVVTYADTGNRVPGSVFHSVRYKDRLYLFASSVEEKLFKEEPEKYENADLALSGQCVVTLMEENDQVPGLPQWEELLHGKRYRFSTPEAHAKFLADPEKYEEK